MRFWQALTWVEPDQLLDAARFAEEVGFDGCMLADHGVFPRDVRSAYPYATDGAPPMAYFALGQHPGEYARNLYVRVAGASEGVHDEVRAAIAKAEPHLALREVLTLSELTGRSVALERLISSLVSAFSVIAVIVASLGLFGTLSYKRSLCLSSPSFVLPLAPRARAGDVVRGIVCGCEFGSVRVRATVDRIRDSARKGCDADRREPERKRRAGTRRFIAHRDLDIEH